MLSAECWVLSAGCWVLSAMSEHRESSETPLDDEVARINEVADELNREAEDVLEYQVF